MKFRSAIIKNIAYICMIASPAVALDHHSTPNEGSYDGEGLYVWEGWLGDCNLYVISDRHQTAAVWLQTTDNFESDDNFIIAGRFPYSDGTPIDGKNENEEDKELILSYSPLTEEVLMASQTGCDLSSFGVKSVVDIEQNGADKPLSIEDDYHGFTFTLVMKSGEKIKYVAELKEFTNTSLTVFPLASVPVAMNDTVTVIDYGTVSIDPLENDNGLYPRLDATTVVLTGTVESVESTLTEDGKTLTVPSEGEWKVDETSGLVTFIPAVGFFRSSTSVRYTVANIAGDVSNEAVLSVNFIGTMLINEISDDLEAVLAENRANTLTMQSGLISDYASDAADRLRQRRAVAVSKALPASGVDTSGYVSRGYGLGDSTFSNQGACEDSFSLMRTLNAHANNNSVNADGQFMRDQHDCITDRREVFSGLLSYSDTEQGQTQGVINLSYRREQYRGSDSVFGYFIGLYNSQSDVTRLANGEISGIGLNTGIYSANRLSSDVILDYYLGAAAGRHIFDLAFARDIGTISATGEYQYIAAFAGAALSGELALGDTTLNPRAGFDYIYTPGSYVDVVAELSGLSDVGGLELDTISGSRLFAELRWNHLVDDDQANLWLTLRVACYQSLGSLDNVCGFGGSLGIESTVDELTYALKLDSEWGHDYTLGSITARVGRQLDIGTINADTTISSKGTVTLGGTYEIKF